MKLEKIAYNIFNMTNVSFSFYENNSKSYETNHLLLPEQLKYELDENKHTIITNHKDNKILRIQYKYGLTFLCLYLNQKNIIFGPFLINDDYEKDIDELIMHYKFINEEAYMLENFYGNLKVLSEFQQNLIIKLIQNANTLDFENIKIHNVQVKKIDNHSFYESQAFNFNTKMIESNYEIEKSLLKIVRNGDVEAAVNFDFHKTANQMLIYQNNSFTNMKTNLMIFDALCNREILKCGVDLHLANKISNNIKFQINKISLSSELRNIAQKILFTYSKVVRDYTLPNNSSNIKKIILFIRKNLTEKISLEDIAKKLFITKEHLSRLFKKEMGITISEYIIKTKIEEAKKMLKNTDHNILDIAQLLNFANSSHFSNSFKKITGVSPTDYRKNSSN